MPAPDHVPAAGGRPAGGRPAPGRLLRRPSRQLVGAGHRALAGTDRLGAGRRPRLEALRTKFRFYAQDPCWSGDAAKVFPRCGRFTTEIRNVLPQVRQDAPRAATQADLVGKALDDFAAKGCQADPAPSPKATPPSAARRSARSRRPSRAWRRRRAPET
ncbi:hypothetical protein [Pseudonocardia sp. ICBG601]|uniref:hypothetical protein n=1 Tax=Pseudonocardia sp. ICBG601 TaxID=2846759 RepID=UPI001CF619C8|nr:hypothetical protein [Pseudonocardia sp. ICBG601]